MLAKQSHNQLAEVSQGRGHMISSQESHWQSCAALSMLPHVQDARHGATGLQD